MKYFKKYAQFGRFVIVGALNTLVDLGVLNALMFFSGISSGIYFTLFKATSFLVAVTNSYIWNKRWTFKSLGKVSTREYVLFGIVSVVGMVINVTTASLIVNAVTPPYGIGLQLWANIGALLAIAVSFIWNFFGYRNIVFGKRKFSL